MDFSLVKNAYGKNAVNLSKIIRHADHHEFRQISVNVSLQGDFDSAHTGGDNSKLLPTDTQKNTVYALAKEKFNSSIENFARDLSSHFVANNSQVSTVTIEIEEHSYRRMEFDTQQHPHAYISNGNEKHFTIIEQSGQSLTIRSGVKDLLIVKTTDSGFENYIRDAYTTLRPTADRILATKCEASWKYNSIELDFETTYQEIRTSLLKTFAFHKSLSVQHTLYAMAEDVLKKVKEIDEISLVMPNKHHILFNLEQFGMTNENDVFIATDEPYGYITGTVARKAGTA